MNTMTETKNLATSNKPAGGKVRMTPSEAFIETLVAHKVKDVFGIVGSDFVPKDDQSEFEVAITLPPGYSLDRADETCKELEKRMATLPGVPLYHALGFADVERVTLALRDDVEMPFVRMTRRIGS